MIRLILAAGALAAAAYLERVYRDVDNRVRELENLATDAPDAEQLRDLAIDAGDLERRVEALEDVEASFTKGVDLNHPSITPRYRAALGGIRARARERDPAVDR